MRAEVTVEGMKKILLYGKIVSIKFSSADYAECVIADENDERNFEFLFRNSTKTKRADALARLGVRKGDYVMVSGSEDPGAPSLFIGWDILTRGKTSINNYILFDAAVRRSYGAYTAVQVKGKDMVMETNPGIKLVPGQKGVFLCHIVPKETCALADSCRDRSFGTCHACTQKTSVRAMCCIAAEGANKNDKDESIPA